MQSIFLDQYFFQINILLQRVLYLSSPSSPLFTHLFQTFKLVLQEWVVRTPSLQLPFVCTVLDKWNCSWQFGRQTFLSNKVLVTCYCSAFLEELSCCFLLLCKCKWFIAENLKNTILDLVPVAALIKTFTKLQHFLSGRILPHFCKVLSASSSGGLLPEGRGTGAEHLCKAGRVLSLRTCPQCT